MNDQCGVRRGQVVYGCDGVRLGRVFHCDVTGFVVEKGIVFPEDYPVFYDEVLSADGDEVRLCVSSDALVREAEAEPWDPARDPEGTDSGIDLEPLRAGMAEVDEAQVRLRALEAGLAEEVPLREGGWASRARLVRALRAGELPVAGPTAARELSAEEQRELASLASAVAELESRISQEVEDYERGGACECPDALAERELRAAAALAARLQRRLTAAARRAGGVGARAGRRDRRSGASEGRPGTGRIDYARSAPEAVAALRRVETYVRGSGLERPLLELVRLRASQLNGCRPCTELHGEVARRLGVDAPQLEALAAWPESPLFTERERAALAWTDAVTRVGAAAVVEEVYQKARDHFGERGLVDLTMAIVAINGWNRLAVAFESELGAYRHAVT